jgi:hypothetical protein
VGPGASTLVRVVGPTYCHPARFADTLPPQRFLNIPKRDFSGIRADIRGVGPTLTKRCVAKGPGDPSSEVGWFIAEFHRKK